MLWSVLLHVTAILLLLGATNTGRAGVAAAELLPRQNSRVTRCLCGAMDGGGSDGSIPPWCNRAAGAGDPAQPQPPESGGRRDGQFSSVKRVVPTGPNPLHN